MKRFYRILSLLFALLMLLGTLAACATRNTPLNAFKKSLLKTLDRRFGGEVVEILLDTAENGRFQLDLVNGKAMELPFEGADLTLYLNRDKGVIKADGHLLADGKKYDGSLYLTEKEMAISSTALFGSTTLGVNFKTLEKDLSNSIFKNDSGTAYARPEIDANAATDAIDLKNGIFSLYRSIGELMELSDDLADEFLRALAAYSPHSYYKEDGIRHLTLTVGNSELSRALRDTYAVAVKDKTLCRELRELAKTRDMLETVKENALVTTHTDRVEELLLSTLPLEELCNKIDAMPTFELSLNAEINARNGQIKRAKVEYLEESESILSFSLDLCEKTTNKIALVYGGYERTLAYTVTKKTFSRYESELTYQRTGEDDSALSVNGILRVDKKADTFRLAMTKGDTTRVFEGDFDRKADGFELAVRQMKINEVVQEFTLFFAAKADAKVDELPEYVNLATVTEGRFQPIHDRAVAAREELSAALGDFKLTPRLAAGELLRLFGIEEEINHLPLFEQRDE